MAERRSAVIRDNEFVKIWSDVKHFWSHRFFAMGIPFAIIMSYLTLLVHPTVGIDDTSGKLYYVDGVSPAMGRWCLYLINKVIPLNFNPHFVEAAGLCCFGLSITLWCVVFYRMFGGKLSTAAYAIFGMVMLSSPIISEVVIWYLHDGIYLGYGFTALAVLFAMKTFQRDWRKRWPDIILAAVMLTAAVGFYEAFMIVFLMAMIMNFMLIHALDKRDYSRKISDWLLNLVMVCICAMLLRSVTVNSIIFIDHLQEQANVLESRGLDDILGMLAGWFDGTRTVSDFTFILKDFFVKYYLHAIVYTPIMIFVAGGGVLVCWSVVNSARRKDGWIIASAVGIMLLPWLMPVLEGQATYYRASEYVPLFTAFAVLLVAWEIRDVKKRGIRAAAYAAAFILLYRQGYEMNRWLYADAMKYENDKLVMNDIALRILEKCDVEKPVCIIGSHPVPESLISEVYVPEWSKKYKLVSLLVKAVDEEIFDKYDVEGKGYATAETPALSMIEWGIYAYGMPGSELIKFWEMHGFTFQWDDNIQHYEDAWNMMQDGPAWPREGSIVEMEDYIIVNLGE